MPRRFTATVLGILLAAAWMPARAQRELAGTPEIKLALDRLNVLGSALMIGAHPDDENTALLAWLARGRKLRTAYLSLTRGEGGQNLIGPEQGDLMGVIRTQELLAARRIDGATQFFTRAIDFGYSKTADETLALWGRERILGDVVWVIRRFRPDVIVLRFSGTSRDGHGHHQSSAILGKEAFAAAAGKNRFPEQLRYVQPWQARRLLWNVFTFRAGDQRAAERMPNRVEVDTGEYNPVLGFSYGEIAGMSRSMHRSQGFGSAERRGSMTNFLSVVAGEVASGDLMEGVDTTWNRVAGGAPVGEVLAEAARSFDPEHPEKIVPLLLKARSMLAGLTGPWVEEKRNDLDEVIGLAMGLWLDASADRHAVVPGETLKISLTALNRSAVPAALAGIDIEGAGPVPAAALERNLPVTRALEWKVPAEYPYTQPYWLRKPKQGAVYAVDDPTMIGLPENGPVLTALFRLKVDGYDIALPRPLLRRYVDRVRGELTRPLEVVPPVAVEFAEDTLLYPAAGTKRLDVQVTANSANASGEVRLVVPDGWRVSPDARPVRLAGAGSQAVVPFEVTPPARQASGDARAVATVGGVEVSSGMKVIDYPHIPPQTVFPPSNSHLVRSEVATLARKVGYVMGAGDEVPRALHQLGCEVTLLGPQELARGDLGRFDAIVTGVRAYNTRPDLRSSQQRLLAYVDNGGTMVVQYNVLEGGFLGGDPSVLDRIGPFPMKIGRERVSVEDAPIRFPDPAHPVLSAPNRIGSEDFNGWVQERGLYFASEWDPRYQPLWESNDPGEASLPGGALYARYGKGVYIFTAYSWFRQLPAGVPGAFRIFANLLSAGKTIR